MRGKLENNNKNVATVQWLRGIAAMMIVLHHARNSAPWLYNPLEHYPAFAWGVDIFFVISGFIMFVAARNEPPIEFIKRRIVRVVPLYWLTTLGLLIVTVRQHTLPLSGPELDHLIKSLLFVPHYSLTSPAEVWPYLIPGWTLNYEMFFYLVFFVALLAKRPLEIVTATIVVLVALGLSQPANADPLLKTYTSPLMLEFVAGVWIGKLYVSKSLGWRFVVLLPIGFIGLLVLPIAGDVMVMMVGRLVFSTMILTGTVSVARTVPSIPILKRLGDASYSIYLSHTVIGLQISKRIVSRIPIDGWVQSLVWVVVSLVICGIVGYAIHVLVEKPLLKALRNIVSKKEAD